MFSMPDMAVILAIALVIFGPKKLPEIGASLGKGIRGFKKATEEGEETLKATFTEIEAGKTLTAPSAQTVAQPEPGIVVQAAATESAAK
jgi:sec-independent protein translocase protein TatA